jgi:hypothetical protein
LEGRELAVPLAVKPIWEPSQTWLIASIFYLWKDRILSCFLSLSLSESLLFSLSFSFFFWLWSVSQ